MASDIWNDSDITEPNAPYKIDPCKEIRVKTTTMNRSCQVLHPKTRVDSASAHAYPCGNQLLNISLSQAEFLRYIPEPSSLKAMSPSLLATKRNGLYLSPSRVATSSWSIPSSPSDIPPVTESHTHSEVATTSNVTLDQFSQLTQPERCYPSSCEEYVQKAIEYHERGELEQATEYFRIAAENNSPLGMFLYGVSLRHGWGCQIDQAVAFQFLQRAAEHAIFDLGDCPIIARSQLALAIYELGMCFRHGWGVVKSKITAAYYFEIAAILGDPDAQAELAFCCANGIGVKKDRYKAAKYYKLAHAQGVSMIGNSWIFKEKYKNC